MTTSELIEWFTKRAGRAPEAWDVWKVAKEFFQLGAYSRALACLQHYVALPAATNQGRHLLAYCYLNLGEIEYALREFKKSARDGYNEDWQFVVELTFELEERNRLERQREIRA
ncbi:hypothetical protein M427DRAFT_133564 [Gonapodya prolifera JEL478]|uniref:TPR-like protein n=1 Tax=Gonapodya prolifera (strain JEL478) TaxID=1344416 RepID=A0A139AJY7_GONPJ|nr:hypothetical protein M427DRAFT_133564 [Gonapodya prolifera JEL478]|eukprot:KXS17089.1 hypothetical protein M427DRAFT_133564 [Gonapodya prolifera JEL478]